MSQEHDSKAWAANNPFEQFLNYQAYHPGRDVPATVGYLRYFFTQQETYIYVPALICLLLVIVVAPVVGLSFGIEACAAIAVWGMSWLLVSMFAMAFG